jgi:uncharacterized protein
MRDRTARLLRNQLSHALDEALAGQSPAPFRERGHELLARAEKPAYQAFVRDRLARYDRAFAEIAARGLDRPWEQALVLWNHRLFFEVHDLLELEWRQAREGQRLALRAVIQAAAVYVHLDRGNSSAARRLAARAILGLRAHGRELPPFSGLAQLLTALEHLEAEPPRLEIGAGTAFSAE